MANTTTWKGNTINITGLDADWDAPTDLGMDKIKVRSIEFLPSAANDHFIICEGSLTGPSIMDVTCSDAMDNRRVYFDEGLWMTPYIDISECTLGTAADAKVTITVV